MKRSKQDSQKPRFNALSAELLRQVAGGLTCEPPPIDPPPAPPPTPGDKHS